MSFFVLELGTAISEAKQVQHLREIRKEEKSERRMPWLSGGEEGRGKLRKGSGNCKQVLIRAYPNGATQWFEEPLLTLVRANPGN